MHSILFDRFAGDPREVLILNPVTGDYLLTVPRKP
jgi:hypothetical protein